jgi:hypothetical protein
MGTLLLMLVVSDPDGGPDDVGAGG